MVSINQNTMNKQHILFLALFLSVSLVIHAQDFKSLNEARGLETGIKAPLFKAKDMNSSFFNLEQALEKGPVVLIFYRGHWCPVCNAHLSNLQDSLSLIYDLGAQVVAISPENPEYLEMTSQKTGAEFTLLYDEGYTIASAYDVAFQPTSAGKFLINTFTTANLKNAHSDESQRLPIPATYIINPDGYISWRHVNPDYKKRASIQAIIGHLKTVRKK